MGVSGGLTGHTMFLDAQVRQAPTPILSDPWPPIGPTELTVYFRLSQVT
jgi:hypothetical protein